MFERLRIVFVPMRIHPSMASPAPHSASAAPSADAPEAEPTLIPSRLVIACAVSSGLTSMFGSGWWGRGCRS